MAGRTKIRVGGPGDGGYVQLEENRPGTAVSLGVSMQSPWDLEMAQKGWQVLQFDGTIETPPQQHPNMRFFRKNVTAAEQHPNNEISFNEILNMLPENGNNILQMDIEGGEWAIFESVQSLHLLAFSQIIVEFHGMHRPNNLENRQKIFKKLCLTHTPVHFHYNNYGSVVGFRDFLVSSLWEVTFVRKDSHIFMHSTAEYPTSLDSPNNRSWPEIYIGKFQIITQENG